MFKNLLVYDMSKSIDPQGVHFLGPHGDLDSGAL